MKHLKHILASPYFLSLIPLIIVILLVHNGFKRYVLEIENSGRIANDLYVSYDDLDNDGSSEELVAVNQPTSTGIAISSENGIINQFSFSGNFNFLFKSCLFITGDRDSDGIKEIYAFTISDDSIFLHSITDYRNALLPVKTRFIATTGPGLKNPDPFIIPAEMEDLDGDGIKELIFGIGSGFSEYPRKVFAYFISEDSLISSPESSYYLWKILQTDITGNGKKEIIPYGYATSNVSPEKAKYHDCSSFLMVLDQNLKFLFPPLEFKGRYSKVTPFIKETEKGNFLGVLYNPSSSLFHSSIYFVSPQGSLTDSIHLPYYSVDCINTTFNGKNNLFLMIMPKDRVGLFNADFKPLRLITLENKFDLLQNDFDSDGKKEILITAPEKNRISVFREGLNNPVSLSLPYDYFMEEIISLKINNLSGPLISIQSGQQHLMLKYRQNPAYPYYYLLYPGIYLAILAFTMTVRNIQQNQLRKKYDNEKKISQLQLALIRNQLDPHFSLNVINSIIYSVEYADREQAADQLRQFARLYRSMLLSANSIHRSIRQELEFCEEYLLLEKMRFGERFEYRVSVADDVNIDKMIPKLLIQIHVENAIKHGLTPLDKGGILNINIGKFNDDLLIEIIDNGIGREKSGDQMKMTTGKGLEIMSELYLVYNKCFNEKISSEITDLYHENGQSAGTKVSIRISRETEKA